VNVVCVFAGSGVNGVTGVGTEILGELLAVIVCNIQPTLPGANPSDDSYGTRPFIPSLVLSLTFRCTRQS
jgi:hypothetical protein